MLELEATERHPLTTSPRYIVDECIHGLCILDTRDDVIIAVGLCCESCAQDYADDANARGLS